MRLGYDVEGVPAGSVGFGSSRENRPDPRPRRGFRVLECGSVLFREESKLAKVGPGPDAEVEATQYVD